EDGGPVKQRSFPCKRALPAREERLSPCPLRSFRHNDSPRQRLRRSFFRAAADNLRSRRKEFVEVRIPKVDSAGDAVDVGGELYIGRQGKTDARRVAAAQIEGVVVDQSLDGGERLFQPLVPFA